MRVAHSADPHLGRTTHSAPGSQSRAEDHAATLMRFAEAARDAKADLAVIAGDLFHTRRPSPRDLRSMANFVAENRANGISTLIVSGNHDGNDAVGDEETSTLGFLGPLRPPGLMVVTKPVSRTVKTLSGESFNLVATPYPHKRSFDAVMPDAEDDERIEAVSVAYERAVDTLLDTVKAKQPDLPTLFAGHIAVLTGQLGSEQTMKFGMDVAVRSGLFDKTDYAALGHLHRQQRLGDKAWYAGSPERMDFGEAEQSKGFLIVDIRKGRMPDVEVIDSQPRAMAEIELRETASGWSAVPDIDPAGVIVKLNIYPLLAIRPSDVVKMVADYRRRGASYVQHQTFLPERTRIRVALTAESGEETALKAYLAANNYDIEPALTEGMSLVNLLRAE